MALRATGWTSGLTCLLCVIMAAFAVFMEGILCRKSLSFCLGFMAFQTQLAGRLALFPGVMALHAVDLKCLGVLLMGKFDLAHRGIQSDLIFCSKYAANHQNGENKTNENTQT